MEETKLYNLYYNLESNIHTGKGINITEQIIWEIITDQKQNLKKMGSY